MEASPLPTFSANSRRNSQRRMLWSRAQNVAVAKAPLRQGDNRMLGTILHGPRDVRCEEVAEPKIQKPTDATIRLSATCICGSDLWPFRGLNEVKSPMAMGHE